MQFSNYDADGLPRSSGPTGPSGSPGRYYAIGGALIVVAVLAFAFLSGATAVFVGIAAAVAGAVFVLMGVQGSGDTQPDALEQEYYSAQGGQGSVLPDPAADYDWDGNFKREFGGDGR